MTPSRHLRPRRLGLVVAALAMLASFASQTLAAENAAAIEARLIEDVRRLAADELEGRGIETKGIADAAAFVRDQFKAAGLASGVKDGSFYQHFSYALKAKVKTPQTTLTLKGPSGKELKLILGKDYQPLSFGGAGKIDAPIVFAGYGISASDLGYDDYAGQDLAGKVLLMIRREPQQGDDKSKFDGKKTTDHATFDSKAQLAWTKKAAAVLLVNDHFTVKDDGDDRLIDVNVRGFQNPVGVPFIHITQAVANQLLAGSPLKSLKDAEAQIDKELRPATQPLTGWSAAGDVDFERVTIDLVNVVGVIEGKGPKANETIVFGAHYDHLGRGGEGSLAPRSTEVHNGADDNASGTATLIELARRYGARSDKPARRLVFIAFSGEERGLLGSRHYVKKDPLFELKDTIAMINFDMVGRMRDDKLILYGVDNAKGLKATIEQIEKESGLKLRKVGTGTGPSDNASFYAADIPAFHLFTDLHKDYHRPSDDVDKINASGMRRIVDFSERLADAILALPERPAFVKVGNADPHAGLDLPRTSSMAYLGTSPDYGADVKGVLLSDISPGSPAEKGGLKPGDIIVDIANLPIRDVTGLTMALRKHKPNDTVSITVQRGKDQKVLTVTLGKRGG